MSTAFNDVGGLMELVYVATLLSQLTVGGVFAAMWLTDRDSRYSAWWAASQGLLALTLGGGYFVSTLPMYTPGYWVATLLTAAVMFGAGTTSLAGAWSWLGRMLSVRTAVAWWAAAMGVLLVAAVFGRQSGNVAGSIGFGGMLIAAGVMLSRVPGASRFVGVLFIIRGCYVLSLPWLFERVFGPVPIALGLPAYLLTALGLIVISFRRKAEALRVHNRALALTNTLATLARASHSVAELTDQAAKAIGASSGAQVTLVLHAPADLQEWAVAASDGGTEAALKALGSRPFPWPDAPPAILEPSGAAATAATWIGGDAREIRPLPRRSIEATAIAEPVREALRACETPWVELVRCRTSDGDRQLAVVLGFRAAEDLDQVDASALEAIGQVLGLVVADVQRAEDIEYRATHDELTGLVNRGSVQRELAHRLAGETPRGCALLLLDLDGFKGTNDAFGHHVGDQVLCTVAERLRAVASDRDLVGRLGGDEFAIVVSEQGSGDAHAVAQRALEAVRQPIVVAGVQLRVAGSIGLAHSPKVGGSVSELMRSADLAMFHAKAGSLGVAEFDKTIDAGRSDRLELLAALQRALQGNELELHYQPRIALGDGRVVGWEALLRWRHPGLGLIQPGRFLPTVEASDLIHPLSRWVADTAIAQAQQWRRQGVPGRVAINLSARNLLDARWPSLLRQLLQKHGLPPGLLEIEITETAFVQDTAVVEELLRGIEAIGIRLAVDDYGVGYSSLSYLKRFPIHALKIDRIFIADLVRDRQDAAIVRSTIELAHELGLEVTAEGVEDEATHEFLAQLGCDGAQGYHFAYPMRESDVADWLRTRALELRSECVETLSRTSQWSGLQS